VVDLRPLDIEKTRLRVDGSVDVVHESKLAERELEQGAPGGLVGIMEVKDLRHMVFDVQQGDG
jgi:hypothetical protein